MLFLLTATLNAQLKNVDGTTNDEYLGKQPLTGGECNCVNSDIPNFNFSFSSDFSNAIANDRAVIEAAERTARDWYNHQTDLMKDYIGYKNNKTFSTYDEARNYFYRKTENNYIRNNAPSAKQKIASTYYNANNAEKTGLKGLKALSYREGEINKGNLDNSLYADFKVNGVPLKDIRTISELNNIRATVNTSTVKGLWQSDQYYDMLNEINSMISSSNYSELENLAFNKKNSLYHGYNYWDKLNMMQLQLYFQDHTQYVSYPHFLTDGIFEKFHNTIEIATPNFIENEIEKNYTEYDLFHADHWKIILRDKYNNNGLYTHVAKADHQALMNAELNRLKSQTPMGASLNVDKIVQQFQIRDKNQYEWLNANPPKADEFLKRMSDAKALDKQETSEPIPDNEIISVVGENYNTEVNAIGNEIDYGGRIVSLIKELNITDPNEKKALLQNFDRGKELVDFANLHRLNNTIINEAKDLILGQVELDGLSLDLERKWNPNVGKINGRDDQKYTHTYSDGIRTWHLMDDNSVVLFSNTRAKLGKHDQVVNIFTSEGGNNGYWYFMPEGADKWYNYLIKQNSSTADELKLMFELGAQGLVKFFGRYVVPAEDIKIIFTGTDLDGVSSSRWLSGGMLIIDLAGGKIFKAIATVAEGTRVWRITAEHGGRIYTKVVNAISEATLKLYDIYGQNLSKFVDQALRKGELSDDIINETAEILEDLKNKKGSKLTWDEVKALFKRGNDFNDKAKPWYPYHEIHLANGKRLDSWDDLAGEIISRKATDLGNIKFSTFEKYLKEFAQKYSPGTRIRSNKYIDDIDGKFLEGTYVLEIPDSNLNLSNIQEYIDYAWEHYNVKLRFRPE